MDIKQNCVVRYRGLLNDKDKVFNALKNDRLYFSTALGYNDPYDTLMYVDYEKLMNHIRGCWTAMPEYVEHVKENNFLLGSFAEYVMSDRNMYKSKFQEEFLRQIRGLIETLKEVLHKNIKGICFSENAASVLMWSHYASNHSGIALLYDRDELVQAKSYNARDEELGSKFSLEQIRYSKERVDATGYINDYVLNKLKMELKITDDAVVFPKPNRTILKDIILTKNDAWSYEHEVRLIPRRLEFEQESPIQYLLLKPKGIILGARISDEDKREVNKIAKAKKIKLYEDFIDESQKDYNVVIGDRNNVHLSNDSG